MSTRIITTDDFAASQGILAEADGKTYMGLNGEWREIDLTDENSARYMDAIRPFWAIGRPCAAPEAGNSMDLASSRRHLGKMREWFEERGYPYQNESGKYYYHREHVREYAEWLTSQGRPVPQPVLRLAGEAA